MTEGDSFDLAEMTTRFKREIDELAALVRKDSNYSSLEKDKVKKEVSSKFSQVIAKEHFFIRKGIPGAKRLWWLLKKLNFLTVRAIKNSQPIEKQEKMLEELVLKVDKIIVEAEMRFAKKKQLSLSFRSL